MSPQADWTVTTPALTPAAAAMQVYNTGSSLDVRDAEAEADVRLFTFFLRAGLRLAS